MQKTILTIFVLCWLILSSTLVISSNQKQQLEIDHNDDLDDYIINEMENMHIPGLSATIVSGTELIWEGSYGFADIEKNINVTNNTLFKIASVSKTITATALMQLYEEELFDLYDPINNYLPYSVIHPNYPSTQITFHMLLTHSSGIIDNWAYLFHYVGDAPISFQTFLMEYLLPGGAYYDADSNFGSWEPGTSWSYTNIGVALIGFLVETISGMNFTTYIETKLFNYLDMNESGWYLRDLNLSHIAMPYFWDGSNYVSYGHIGWVDVPAGDLRTSATQLIHFLTMFINHGVYQEQQILKSSTIELMLTPQLPFNPNLGLIWWKSFVGSRIVWGHGGSDYGARAFMQFDPSTNIGVVVLINGEAGLTAIGDKLFTYAETLLNNTAPYQPQQPEGTTNGKINVEYFYSTNTSDDQNDVVYYFWDWGDGNCSDWLGPYDSGELCLTSYIWKESGNYQIRVKAKDSKGAVSEWSDPLAVSMPKTNSLIQLLFLKFLQRFPVLQLIFQIV